MVDGCPPGTIPLHFAPAYYPEYCRSETSRSLVLANYVRTPPEENNWEGIPLDNCDNPSTCRVVVNNNNNRIHFSPGQVQWLRSISAPSVWANYADVIRGGVGIDERAIHMRSFRLLFLRELRTASERKGYIPEGCNVWNRDATLHSSHDFLPSLAAPIPSPFLSRPTPLALTTTGRMSSATLLNIGEPQSFGSMRRGPRCEPLTAEQIEALRNTLVEVDWSQGELIDNIKMKTIDDHPYVTLLGISGFTISTAMAIAYSFTDHNATPWRIALRVVRGWASPFTYTFLNSLSFVRAARVYGVRPTLRYIFQNLATRLITWSSQYDTHFRPPPGEIPRNPPSNDEKGPDDDPPDDPPAAPPSGPVLLRTTGQIGDGGETRTRAPDIGISATLSAAAVTLGAAAVHYGPRVIRAMPILLEGGAEMGLAWRNFMDRNRAILSLGMGCMPMIIRSPSSHDPFNREVPST